LDGEGGYSVWGKLVPARVSVERSALPIGLANDVRMTQQVLAGEILSVRDVALDTTTQAYALRRETCAMVAG
jgi:predicted homoserine dehydrogenase-like protein